MKNLRGKTAVVTGGSTGIGLAIAVRLAERGANLVLAARTPQTLAEAAAVVDAFGANVLTVPTDVADRDQLERLVDRTTRRFGGVDVLVNNAGIETYADFHELSLDDLVRTIDVNLTSALLLTRLVVAHALHAGTDLHVLNVSSTAGKHGPPYGAAYGASKAGLISLTETLRVEYRGRGISASVVCPGFTNSGGMYERMKREIGRGTPFWIGHTSAETVARAAVRAIESDRAEAIVNNVPFRPFAVLAEAFPAAGEWLYRHFAKRWLGKVAGSRRPDRDESRRAA